MDYAGVVTFNGTPGIPTNTGLPIQSFVYYLPIMGNAQQALAYILGGSGGSPPVSPIYSAPPLDPTRKTQFDRITNAIGVAIGNIAAHETGHQLPIHSMDCGISGHASCDEDYIYENGGSGSNHEWFYGDVPGEHIHWSHSAVCAITKYLLGKEYVCN